MPTEPAELKLTVESATNYHDVAHILFDMTLYYYYYSLIYDTHTVFLLEKNSTKQCIRVFMYSVGDRNYQDKQSYT